MPTAEADRRALEIQRIIRKHVRPERIALRDVTKLIGFQEAAEEIAALRATSEGAREMREDAETFARRAHAGQVDAAGLPYAGHLGRVAARARAYAEALGWSQEDAEICESVGWLHDVIEDGWATAATVNRDFEPAVAYAVGALTRDPDETYADYIQGIVTGTSPIVRIVKLADLNDNLDPARAASLPDSLRRRYEAARAVLIGALPSLPAGSVVSEPDGGGQSGGRES